MEPAPDQVEPICSLPGFDPEAIKSKSFAASSLCAWVLNMVPGVGLGAAMSEVDCSHTFCCVQFPFAIFHLVGSQLNPREQEIGVPILVQNSPDVQVVLLQQLLPDVFLRWLPASHERIEACKHTVRRPLT